MHGMENGIAVLILITVSRSGSSINTECKIDSIVQSWSVLSGAWRSFELTKQAWKRR